MTVGYYTDQYGYSVEYTGQYSMLNIFSSPLSPERLVAVTQAGSEDCGAPGDVVSWVDAGWQLHSQASIKTETLEGPCQREGPLYIVIFSTVLQ